MIVIGATLGFAVAAGPRALLHPQISGGGEVAPDMEP
jgi:hypothetical protein